MKSKLVIWGTDAQKEKVLIALELQAAANKVQLYTFPEAIASEDFVTKMMQEWRNGSAEVAFPDGHGHRELELSVTDGLLPDDLHVDRPDLITRAQTEWHFTVLSAKLNEAYRQELAEFRERIAALENYDGKHWDSLKHFWDKVQSQVKERNLFREHADDLRDGINGLFEDLKKMKSKLNEEFSSTSAKVYEEMSEALAVVEQKIAAGGNKLGQVFDDLKKLQSRYRESKMTNEHRNQLWDRLDGAFKAAKEKRFGPNANEGSLVERHARRMQGLVEAIRRMEDSVRRDEEDLQFQAKKVKFSEGQLESQIRQAKIKMVEERLESKKVKLAEMQRTRADVERQINQAKSKENRRVERDVDRQKVEEAKEKIRAEMKAASGKPVEVHHEESFLETAGTLLGEVFENALDTVKAVGKVAGQKAEEWLEQASEKVDDVKKAAAETAEDVQEAVSEKMDDVKAAVSEKVADAKAAVAEKAEDLAEALKEEKPKGRAKKVAAAEPEAAAAEKPKRAKKAPAKDE